MKQDSLLVSGDALSYAAAVLDACPEPLAISLDGERVTYANRAFCRLAGVERVRDLKLQDIGQMFASGNEMEAGPPVASETGHQAEKQDTGSRSCGGEPLVNFRTHRIECAGSGPGGLLIAFSPRGPRHLLQRRYKHDLELLKSISASTSDAILTLNERGIVETAGAAIESMFGYSPAELVGMELGNLVSRRQNGERFAWVRESLKNENPTGSRIAPNEFIGRRKDGRLIPVEVSISEIDRERHFTCMIRDVSERKRLEQQVLDISADEQRRIGLELHDDTLQALTAVQLMAEELTDLLEPDSREANLARTLAKNSAAASRRARLLARGLIPTRIPAGGLLSAVRTLAQDVGELHAVTVRVEVNADPGGLPDGDVSTHVFRIVQEAASNAARHSGSDEVLISFDRKDRHFVIQVSDQGTGFVADDPDTVPGLGLKVMAYRADLIGAELSIEHWRGGGTAVVLSVPYYPDQAGSADTGRKPGLTV